MADKYSTIQQHQPLRVPTSFDKQGRALIVQLDEIFDDIYKRFGRLRLEDMGKVFRKQIADDEGNITELVATTEGLTTRVSNAEGNITALDQRADSIELNVSNKYTKVSGITIDTNGVDITGNKYVKISGDGTAWEFIKEGLYAVLSNADFSIGSKALTSGRYGTQIIPGNGLTFKMRGMNGSTGQMFDAQLDIDIAIPYKWADTPASHGRSSVTKIIGASIIGEIGKSVDAIHARSIYAYTLEPMDVYHDTTSANYEFQTVSLGSIGTSTHKWDDIYGTDIHYSVLTQMSSREVKRDIFDMNPTGQRLDLLRPVTFSYKDDPKGKTRYGLIYEDTLPVMPEICVENDQGEKAINYMELVPMLLKEIQDLRKRVSYLEERVCMK